MEDGGPIPPPRKGINVFPKSASEVTPQSSDSFANLPPRSRSRANPPPTASPLRGASPSPARSGEHAKKPRAKVRFDTSTSNPASAGAIPLQGDSSALGEADSSGGRNRGEFSEPQAHSAGMRSAAAQGKWLFVQKGMKELRSNSLRVSNTNYEERVEDKIEEERASNGEDADDDVDVEKLIEERKAREERRKQLKLSGQTDAAGNVVVNVERAEKKRSNPKLIRQSIIMCTDPNCNRCPPEMHMHMRKVAATAKLPTINYNTLDWDGDFDSEEDEQESQLLVTLRCCGLRFTYRRPHNICAYLLAQFWPPPILSPHNAYVKAWMRTMLAISLITFFLDPMFLLVQAVSQEYYCIYTKWAFTYTLVVLRSIVDVATLFNMMVHSRLAFTATYVHVKQGNIRNSAGEPVKLGDWVINDERAIIMNYVRNFLPWDLLVLIPLPQLITLVILNPNNGTTGVESWQVIVRLAVLLQYIPRSCRVYPVITGTSGYTNVFDTPWMSFVLNIFTFFLGSQVVGCMWYLLTTQRVMGCITTMCSSINGCDASLLVCPYNTPSSLPFAATWYSPSSAVDTSCIADPNSASISYGMFVSGVQVVTNPETFGQWIFSLMWGFQQVSTLAGNLLPSMVLGEIFFMLLIILLGLFLFAFLIGNMQNFLQSLNRRSMEHQLHMRDVEMWMEQRDIPAPLQKRVRQLERYVWAVNQGVNEEEVFSSLTEDIQRDVRRHLSLELIKKCYLLSVMPDTVLDAICERLKHRLYINNTVIIREGYPVFRCFFLLRGQLQSITTNKGRTGFFEEVILGKGDFVGEELLVWFIEKYAETKAAAPKSFSRLLSRNFTSEIRAASSAVPDLLPKSERTYSCRGPVEGFSLEAADIEFVCTQFHKAMQSNEIQKALNVCSLNRRTLAATTIQLWWRSILRKRLGLPMDVFRQAVRTKRLGALLRSMRSGGGSAGSGGSGSFGSSGDHGGKKGKGGDLGEGKGGGGKGGGDDERPALSRMESRAKMTLVRSNTRGAVVRVISAFRGLRRTTTGGQDDLDMLAHDGAVEQLEVDDEVEEQLEQRVEEGKVDKEAEGGAEEESAPPVEKKFGFDW